MADRPIIFSGPMVRALLAGTKTQTRRVLPPDLQVAFDRAGEGIVSRHPNQKHIGWDTVRRLWVREAWRTSRYCDGRPGSDMEKPGRGYGWPIWYAADDGAVTWRGSTSGGPAFVNPGRPRSSIHMPRWASRLTLDVVEVRVQRLQWISDDDCFAEGLEKLDVTLGRNGELVKLDRPWAANEWPQGEGGERGHAQDGWDNPTGVYADLWESLHGRGAWALNPWVAAISFRVTPANIDNTPPEQAGGRA